MNDNKVVTTLIGTFALIIVAVSFINKSDDKSFRHMDVEGVAECEVIADTAEWLIYFEHVGDRRSELNRIVEIEKPKVLQFLVDHGINEKEIEFYNYIKEELFGEGNKYIRYKVGYCVYIKTQAVDTVTSIKNNISELLGADYGIVRNVLELKYSKQSDIECELYKEAIKNAVDKADDVLKAAKLKLKKVIKIGLPRFNVTSETPQIDEGIYCMKAMKKTLGRNAEPEASASNSIIKKKIKAKINVSVGII